MAGFRWSQVVSGWFEVVPGFSKYKTYEIGQKQPFFYLIE